MDHLLNPAQLRQAAALRQIAPFHGGVRDTLTVDDDPTMASGGVTGGVTRCVAWITDPGHTKIEQCGHSIGGDATLCRHHRPVALGSGKTNRKPCWFHSRMRRMVTTGIFDAAVLDDHPPRHRGRAACLGTVDEDCKDRHRVLQKCMDNLPAEKPQGARRRRGRRRRGRSAGAEEAEAARAR